MTHASSAAPGTDTPADNADSRLDDATRAWLIELPKVELHLHLEGAIPHAALFELARKYGDTSVGTHPEAFSERFRFVDFDAFIRAWVWKNSLIRELDDFRFIAGEVGRWLTAQNVLYAEFHVSPADFFPKGFSIQGVCHTVHEALEEVGLAHRLIVDVVRNYGPESAERQLPEIIACRDAGVAAIGLGGHETSHPAASFERAFQMAADAGLRATVHAGESAGPWSIAEAMRLPGVTRIGHGTSLVDDPALLAEVVARGVHIEACPLSNVATGAIPHAAAHPLRALLDAGVSPSLNTDDPGMFGNDLATEYASAMVHSGLTRAELRKCLLSAAAASCLPWAERRRLVGDLVAHDVWTDEG